MFPENNINLEEITENSVISDNTKIRKFGISLDTSNVKLQLFGISTTMLRSSFKRPFEIRAP